MKFKQNGNSTIEKDFSKIDIVKYDLEFEVDPLFKLMTAKFGDLGAKGFLLNTLPLDNNIDILLESKNPQDDMLKLKRTANPLSEEIIDIINGIDLFNQNVQRTLI